QNSCPTPIKE
ncbi:hypothetical protein D018_0662B, partial [Vibrio parahaemolyticus VP2007-007]